MNSYTGDYGGGSSSSGLNNSGTSTNGGASNQDPSAGWENILLNSFYGTGVGAGGGSVSGGVGGGGGGMGGSSAMNGGGGTYDSYAAYFGQGTHPTSLSTGQSGGTSQQHQQQHGASPGGGSSSLQNHYYAAAAAAGMFGGGGGYSLSMPSQQGGYDSHGASASGTGGYSTQQQQYGNSSTTTGGAMSQYLDNMAAYDSLNSRGGGQMPLENRRTSHESSESLPNHHQQPADAAGGAGGVYSEYANYYNDGFSTNNAGVSGGSAMGGGGSSNNNLSWGASTSAAAAPHDNSLQEFDYCDMLLRAGGMDASSAASASGNARFNSMFGSAMGVAGGGGRGDSVSYNQYGMGVMVQQQQSKQAKKANALDAFFMTPHTTTAACSKSAPTISSSYHQKNKYRSNMAATTTSTASTYLPHSNSSQPATQIDPLLETFSLSIPAVSLQPLTGSEVVRHIRTKTDDVITRFLPCVEFLVNCQQELRQGLQIANRRKVTQHGKSSRSVANMTPRQFFTNYVAPLPKRFERKNDYIMARDHLIAARLQLDQLVRDAQAALPQGCDHVKNAFLGGMRENESWGLRKWLSKHGGAGSICNDLEEVMRKVKSLNKEDDTTRRLAEILRPIANQAHARLKKEVPQAYQEQSSAHPYLPFFHRLEACLKQMATFNPEEEGDIICLDDSDDEDEPKVVEPVPNETKSSNQKKRARNVGGDEFNNFDANSKKSKTDSLDDFAAKFFGGSDCRGNEETKKCGKDVIVLDLSSDEEDNAPTAAAATAAATQTTTKTTDSGLKTGTGQWRCIHCTFLNEAKIVNCLMCNDDDSENGTELANFFAGGFMNQESNHSLANNATMPQNDDALQAADARELECLADHISSGGSLPKEAHHNVHPFWSKSANFSQILMTFRTIVQHPASHQYLEQVDESQLFLAGLPAYKSIVNHPLCFHAIVSALSRSEDALTFPHLTMRLEKGHLDGEGLRQWNMWNGSHLVEAIDLVLLNALAYAGEGNGQQKAQIEALRKILWDGVNSVLRVLQPDERRDHLPQKRAPSDGFVSKIGYNTAGSSLV